jgi:adenylate cyclase
MTAQNSGLSAVLIGKVSEWLETSALKGLDLEPLVRGMCERIAAAGIPLVRVHLSFSMLHPLYDALGFTWERGKGISVGTFVVRNSEEVSERFTNSPYFHLLKHELSHLRRRITPGAPAEFPIMTDLQAMGATDYLAFVQSFGEMVGQGMLGSWATDEPGGFGDDEIGALLHLQSKLAVSAKMAVLNKLADNMMSTYIGENAGGRVLSGQIRRGDAETIRAVLAMVDMRNSTAFAEQDGREVYVDTLNQFFDAIGTPFHRNGGEILSFVGDGFLAVYPVERHAEPSQVGARAAMSAARQATARMHELNLTRASNGLGPIGYGIGLHMGNVKFGNVGLKNRLTFSAFGSAVNEAQRLEQLTKKFGQPIVASQAFVDYAGGDWRSEGKEQLRGSAQSVAVFVPSDLSAAVDDLAASDRDAAERRSEAEELMLLFRNSVGGRAGQLKGLPN